MIRFHKIPRITFCDKRRINSLHAHSISERGFCPSFSTASIACGTPVIVTECCGIAPLVDQRAGLVVPYNREALQAGLARMLEDAELRQRLRARCTEVARALGWEEPVTMMEDLYAELVKEVRPVRPR
jgi:glycosyltransferase involved in cell wall biosynthesis